MATAQRDVGEVAVGLAPPQAECPADQVDTAGGLRAADGVGTLGQQGVEPLRVELTGVHPQGVAGVLEAHPARVTEGPAQPVHVQLQLLGRILVEPAAPERVDQHVHRYRRVRPGEQDPEQRAGHLCGQRDLLGALPYSQWAEDVELHTAPSDASAMSRRPGNGDAPATAECNGEGQ